MHWKIRLLCATALVVTVSSWAGPLDPAEIPGGARWVVHLDMEAFRASTFGTSVLGELDREDIQTKIAAFKAIFAFDPVRDTRSITLFGDLASPRHGVAILKGGFDPEKVLVLLRANDAYTKATHGAHVLHHWKDDKSGDPEKEHWGCFRDSGTAVIAGTREKLEEALNVLDGREPNAAKGVLSRWLPASQGVVVAAAVDGISPTDAIPPRAQMLRNANSAGLGIWEHDQSLNLEVTVEAKAAETAVAIQQFLQGMIGLALLNQAQDPVATTLAQSAKTQIDGRTVTLHIQCPSIQLFEALKRADERKRAPSAVPTSP